MRLRAVNRPGGLPAGRNTEIRDRRHARRKDPQVGLRSHLLIMSSPLFPVGAAKGTTNPRHATCTKGDLAPKINRAQRMSCKRPTSPVFPFAGTLVPAAQVNILRPSATDVPTPRQHHHDAADNEHD